MKAQILERLRDRREATSSRKLSSELGASDVYIRKKIQSLQELGYPIESTANGFLLTENSDFLHPWEFAGRENSILYLPETESTMDVAYHLATEGCPHFTTVIAEHQTKGRGRMERVWQSDNGGLYFTLVLRPNVAPLISARLNFLASLSIVQVIRKLFFIHARVKWPNDILVAGKKICGILSEIEVDDGKLEFYNLGVGINVNNDPARKQPNAISIKNLLGRKVFRKELMSAFLDDFQYRLDNVNYDRVVENWKAYLTPNQYVDLATTAGLLEGLVIDIDPNGSLIVQSSDHKIKKILYRECFHSNSNRAELKFNKPISL